MNETATTRRPAGNQSVERAFAVLDVLLEHGGDASALELSRATGLDRAIVHRLLRTLTDLEMCTASRGRYELGPQALRLGYAYADRLPYRRLALAASIDLTRGLINDRPWIVSFGAPMGSRVAVIDRIWHAGVPLNALIDVGTQLELDHSSQGRAILARMSGDEIERRLGPDRAAAVAERLDVIRDNDYVESAVGELLPGLFAVATAICDENGVAIGALTISGQYMDEDLGPTSEIANMVKRTARFIEQSISR